MPETEIGVVAGAARAGEDVSEHGLPGSAKLSGQTVASGLVVRFVDTRAFRRPCNQFRRLERRLAGSAAVINQKNEAIGDLRERPAASDRDGDAERLAEGRA